MRSISLSTLRALVMVINCGIATSTSSLRSSDFDGNIISSPDHRQIQQSTQPVLSPVSAVSPVIIGGAIFHDLNEDGIQDADEPGVSDVLVRIYSCNNSTDVGGEERLVESSFSDIDGEYYFTIIGESSSSSSGCYFLQVGDGGSEVTVTNTDEATGDQDVTTYTFSMDNIVYPDVGRTEEIEFEEGEEALDWDVGLVRLPGEDENGDEESGSTNLILSTVGATNPSETSTVGPTNPSEPGISGEEDTIDEVETSNTTSTSTVPTNSISSTTTNTATTQTTPSIASPESTQVQSSPVSIGGLVWIDDNQNGIREDDEEGLQGIIVEVLSCSTQEVIASRTTNSAGQYFFGGFGPAGCYYLLFTNDNDQYEFTTDESGSNIAGASTWRTPDINLNAGETQSNWEIGLVRAYEENEGAQSEVIETTPPSKQPTNAPSRTPSLTLSKPSPAEVSITPPQPEQNNIAEEQDSKGSPPKEDSVGGSSDNAGKPVEGITADESTTLSNKPADTASTDIELDEGKPSQDITSVESTDSGIISLNTNVQVQLENVQSEMSDEAQSTFEDVCSTFLNNQLSIAVPPISNIQCMVVDQSVVVSRRFLQVRRGDQNVSNKHSLQRKLQNPSSLIVDVAVTGEAEQGGSVQEASDVPFQSLLEGTFTVQGFLFTRELKTEESARGGESYFQSVQSVRGIRSQSEVEESEGEGESDEGWLTKGLIAAMSVGGAVLLMLSCFIFSRAREKKSYSKQGGSKLRTPKENLYVDMKKDSAALSKQPPKTNRTAGTSNSILPTSSSASATVAVSPTNSSSSQNDVLSYVATPIASQSGEIEVDIMPPTYSEDKRSTASILKSRIRRQVMAPPGKLGIMVANTTGYGPAVHTIRPGSPMEGVIFVNDIIVSVNDVDTRQSTAEQITHLMKETMDVERKITVLSAHR